MTLLSLAPQRRAVPFDDATRASTGCDGPLLPFGHGLTTTEVFQVDRM